MFTAKWHTGLPKEAGNYLVTYRNQYGQLAVRGASYKKSYWTGEDTKTILFDNEEIIAWSEMPAPFDGDDYSSKKEILDFAEEVFSKANTVTV